MSSDNGAPSAFLHGPAVRISVDLPQDVARALDAWAERQIEPRPDRQNIVLRAVRDWLIALGELPAGADASERRH